MTNQEFSDSFTTLLNSYNTTANFGDQASKMEIVLDEYEKSVLLTQAQDIIVKSYFDNKFNSAGEGFDDSTRRQVDFSTLIKVALLSPTTGGVLYDERGRLFKLPRKIVNGVAQENTTDVLFILNEKLLVEKTLSTGTAKKWVLTTNPSKVYYSEPKVTHIDKSHYWTINDDPTKYYEQPFETEHTGTSTYWTINDEKTHYTTKPEIVYHEGKTTYYTINDSPQKYYGDKPVKTKSSKSTTYYTINSDTTRYTSKPVVVMDSATYYTINDGVTQYDSAEVTNYSPAVSEYWTIGSDTTRFYVDPTDDITYVNKNSYWTISGESEHYSTEPTVVTHTAYQYWTVTANGTTKTYLTEPEVSSRRSAVDDVESAARTVYFIDSDDYGEEGPFDSAPVKTEHNQTLEYWTITQDQSGKVYFNKPEVTETVVQAAHWTYSGIDFYTDSKPSVNHTAAVPASWTVLVNEGEASEDTLTLNTKPKITPHGGTYSVKVDDETIVSGLTSEPTINSTVETTSYWTVDVTGSTEYDSEPTIGTVEGTTAYYTINSIPVNNNKYTTMPVVTEHPGSATYWTVSVNNNTYYEDPTVTAHTDSSMDYYIINTESYHYSTEPVFTVIGGEEPTKLKNEYIIVPISYKEYDREMSKPYAQPLKKQAWRLFQNNSTGFDFDSELIPRFNIEEQVHDTSEPGYTVGDVTLTYKIRYIRRPRPIILENLPNGLEIDGISTYSTCELNPIIHMDILTKAVELALTTRGRMQAPQQEQTRRQ